MFRSYGSARIEGSRRRTVGLMLLAAMTTLAGCIYDAPLTANGTRCVDARLVGDWTSDFAELPFVTVQDLDDPARKYAYLKYALSDDGQHLHAHAVSSETIPSTLKSSSEARRRVRASLEDPQLFVDEPLELSRRK